MRTTSSAIANALSRLRFTCIPRATGRKRRLSCGLSTALSFEMLEPRDLLTGSPWHNEALPVDVNGDGTATASDVFIIVEHIRMAPGFTISILPEAPRPDDMALDVNNDNVVDEQDVYIGIDVFGDPYNEIANTLIATLETMELDVTPAELPTAPYAVDDSYVVPYNAEFIAQATSGVLVNDWGPDGHTLTAHLVSAPQFAYSFDFASDGSFSFEPIENWEGIDSFTYYVTDGITMGNTATVYISAEEVDAELATVVWET